MGPFSALLLGAAVWAGLSGCPDPNGLAPNVEPPTEVGVEGLLGILATPDDVVVPIGETAQLEVTGLFDDRTSNDLTAVATWVSDDPSIVTVSDQLDAEGRLTAHAVGTTTLRAIVGDFESPPIRVEVTEAFLESLSVQPNQVTVEAGTTLQLAASARFSDGTTSDASGQVRWITDDGAVAQLDARGLLTAAGAGSTTIRAQWNDVASLDVPVEVLDSAEPDLAIVWTNLAASSDDTVTFTAAIENVGTAGASAFWVDGFHNPSAPPQVGDLGEQYTQISFLGPGERTEIALTFPASIGFNSVTVLLDSTGAIEEANEGNNLGDAFIEVAGHSPEPNLQITDFSYVADATDIYYVVEVENVGDASAGPFYVDLYVDHTGAPAVGEEGDAYAQIAGLAPGETGSADFIVTQSCFLCSSWAFVDSFGGIPESNESDNLDGPMSVSSNDSSF
jgi:hypothetical protein